MARKATPPAPPPPPEMLPDGGWETDDPSLAAEVAVRAVGGMLRAVRQLVPTYEDAEGKRRHRALPVLGGALHVGQEHGHWMGTVQFRLGELCKKRSPARAALELASGSVAGGLRYDLASAWLRAHGASVRRARVGPGGVLLVAAEGLLELGLLPDRAGADYAEAVRAKIAERVLEGNLLAGPLPLPDLSGAPDVATLAVREGGAEAVPRLERGLPGSPTLWRLKPAALPRGESALWAYRDPLGDRIVRLRTVAPGFTADQFFRVLEI